MKTKSIMTMILALALGLIWATGASAALTVYNGNVPAGFEVSGIIQSATLKTPGDPNSGGTLTINGQVMIVPDNSVIQMPAAALRWAQLFDIALQTAVYDNGIPLPHPANLTITPGTTGLALSDNAAQALGASPWIPFNAIVVGNVDVKNSTGNGAGAYIVGLILPIDQDLGNGGNGFISFIDRAKGRFEVGGKLRVPNTGTIIEINDPLGRYGWAHSPDPRWAADTDNPTITSGNGYPMCVPKVPAPAIDPDCPYYNRPSNPAATSPAHDPFLEVGAPLQAFTMPAKAATNGPGVNTRDPWKKVPFVVGDYVTWAGVLCKLNPAAPLVPYDPTLPVGPGNLPMNQQVYVSANTVSSDKLAVYTAAGSAATVGPAYVQLFRTKIGNGGAPVVVPPDPALGIIGGVIPLPEPRQNIDIAGWCTDSSQLVDIYAVDIGPGGIATDRLLGTVLPEAGAAGGRGNKGRFRFTVGKGSFLPATRSYKAVSRHGQVQLPDQVGLNGAVLPGLNTGAYTAPNFIFQFADAAPGFPNIPNNFDIIPFLQLGEGGNLSAGPLVPFPPTAP